MPSEPSSESNNRCSSPRWPMVSSRREAKRSRLASSEKRKVSSFQRRRLLGIFSTTGAAPRESGDLEHVSGIVAIAFGEAVDFRRAAIPCLGSDLFGAMPIAERDVVDGVRREAG